MQKKIVNDSVPDANNFKPVKIKFYDDGRQMTFSAKDFRDMAIGGAMRKLVALQIGLLHNEHRALTKEVNFLLKENENYEKIISTTTILKALAIQMESLEHLQRKAIAGAVDNYSNKVTTVGERIDRRRKRKSK
jgi:DhnA family fructose-bisphosphate aldolase class Ia